MAKQANGSRTVKSPRVGEERVPLPSSRNSTMVAYEQLRNAILKGEVKPGSHLSQVQVARRFNVGRGPLREAVRLLQQEGFVIAEVNQRARVATFSVEELEQLYAMRIVLEAFAVRTSVALFTAEDLERIFAFLEGMDRTSSSEIAAWRKMHRGFHFAIIARAGERVIGTIRQLYDHCDRYRTIYSFPESYSWLMVPTEHQAIAESCSKRDAVLASKTLAIHLSRTALTMLMMVAPQYDPSAIRNALQLIAGESGLAAAAEKRTDSIES